MRPSLPLRFAAESRLTNAAARSGLAYQPRHARVCQNCRRRLALATGRLTSPFSTTSARSDDAVKGPEGLRNEDLAKTSQGLEWIGTRRWYEEQRRPRRQFKAFGNATAAEDRASESSLRDEINKAVVEVFALRHAAPAKWQSLLATPIRSSLTFPDGVQVGCENNTLTPKLQFVDQDAERQFLEYIQALVANKPDIHVSKGNSAGARAVGKSEDFTSGPPSASSPLDDAKESLERAAGKDPIISSETSPEDTVKSSSTQSQELVSAKLTSHDAVASSEDVPEPMLQSLPARSISDVTDLGNDRPVEPLSLQASKHPMAAEENTKYAPPSSIALNDLKIRFAVAKRVLMRTGLRIRDPHLAKCSTIGAMFEELWRPEPPKKLSEVLLDDAGLVTLPNVKVSPHRITVVHREREAGRWKVIEEELEARGIPALRRSLRGM